MEIMDAIYRRRTVRAYTGEPVQNEILEVLIEAAVQAPSAMNSQPWTFAVVRDQKLLDRVSHGAKAHMLETLPPGGDPHNLRARLSDPGYHIFHHAPVLILISAVSDEPWATENCSLAAENLMLAACARGLGTCWIGFAQRWLQLAEGKAALGLEADCKPVAPIVVGHPKALPPPVPRKKPPIRWID